MEDNTKERDHLVSKCAMIQRLLEIQLNQQQTKKRVMKMKAHFSLMLLSHQLVFISIHGSLN